MSYIIEGRDTSKIITIKTIKTIMMDVGKINRFTDKLNKMNLPDYIKAKYNELLFEFQLQDEYIIKLESNNKYLQLEMLRQQERADKMQIYISIEQFYQFKGIENTNFEEDVQKYFDKTPEYYKAMKRLMNEVYEK